MDKIVNKLIPDKLIMDNSNIWKIIDSHFHNNELSLVRHHTDSYNDFFKKGIFQIFKEKNPIRISSKFDQTINDYRSQCLMYLGGKDGSKIYFGKPVIYDEGNSHYMFPNEARLRNMTYSITVHYDIDIEFISILEPGEMPAVIGIEKISGGDGKDSSDIIPENEPEPKKGGNFKLPQQLGGADKLPQQLGGAGEKHTTLIKRKARTKNPDIQLTPSMAALLREATEKSVNSQNIQRHEITLDKIFLGKFPIMVRSDLCILNGMPREMRYSVGECKNDCGGYFIIDGKEKTVIPQEKFADNMLYIRDIKNDVYSYSAEIRSISENVSKPMRTFSVKMVAPTGKYTNNNIVVNIPNVRKPVPLFIVFRALGFISDKEIISMCLLDLDKYETMIDLFIPSVHDAGHIFTQQNALKYIATLTKGKTVPHALEILSDYFLPHVGEINYIQKAYYLGYIVFRLLSVSTGLEQPTDRDNFKYKRLELVGSLIYDLFREYYSIQQKEIHLAFERILYGNQDMYETNLYGLITQHYKEVFKERTVETGFKRAFKGNWGAYTHTKRIGVIQDLNRLSFNSAIAHLRKTNLPMDAGLKIVGPRLLHCSHWGIIDPIDTPDGGNIGLHKSLAICTHVSQGYSRRPMIEWLREKVKMKLVEECTPRVLASMTKVIINGLWTGSVIEPIEVVAKMKLFRRNALIPIYTSITFEIKLNTIFIYTDEGRLCRPIFYKDELTGKISYDKPDIMKLIHADEFSWDNLITGFNKKKIENFNPSETIQELYELYEGIETEQNPAKLDRFLTKKAIIDYVDVAESENAMISINTQEYEEKSTGINNYHTHSEIHESLSYGIMCNQIIFMENNPPTRNSFSCGQSKQAVSMYHTNFQVRMDKTAVVLNCGQIPLVKSRFLEHINHEENPYGENAIVAIMCYTGYNVEDAILVNEGALKRGLFRTTYYSTYETHEEKSKSGDTIVDTKLTNIESEPNIVGTKPGYDYSQLDKFGLIKENTLVNDKIILIGMSSSNSINRESRIDNSKGPKKGQLGTVDKTFITDGEEGERIAKVRLREERIPSMGDKMASRAGQKGTIGLIVPECDMPFTKDGLRPDLIINPHALPSRMTIGQLVECITGKACAMYGAFGECTAFNNKGSKIGVFGELLPSVGFHSSGNDILYNGMTGQQLETEIFIGPTYYMRLKHMVKDKINFRPLGPRSALTRQPVGGRANDGGLRIGEMERDTVVSHGISNFLRESMMERGDKYYIAVCNQTGMIAIYNPSKNLFMSPMADGPIRLNTSSLDDKDIQLEHITRFGRNFSIVSIPYTMKLLIQELQTINVQMRIITDDNIQQLENMSYSKNLDKLMFGKNVLPKDVVNSVNKILKLHEPYIKTPDSSIPNIPIVPTAIHSKSPEWVIYDRDNQSLQEIDMNTLDPNSPPYIQTSPAYASPEYGSTPDSYSPPYIQTLPAYASPEYDTTPDFTQQPDFTQSRFDQPNFAQSKLPDYSHPLSNYSPHSPDYSPHSPDYSPPPEIFAKNDIVFFRSDTIPNRKWSISKIGDKFITIQTEDDRQLEPDETIKIVIPHEIYKPENIVYSQPNTNYSPLQSPLLNTSSMVPGNSMMPTSGNLIFSPVIQVGSDNKAYPTSEGEPIRTSTTSLANTPSSAASSVEPTNSPIDFNKLHIKKLE